MADHRWVRRAYDDPTKQTVSKAAAKQPTRNPAPDEATNGGAVVHALQRAAGNAAVSALLADQRNRTPSPGEALAPDVREQAERKLGADLASVRVHSDASAAEYAGSLHAEAVTIDQDVFLGSAVNTRTSRGQKTLLHELVHTAQAPDSPASPDQAVGRLPSAPAEAEARLISAGRLDGLTSRPREQAPPAVPHLKAADDEESVPAPDEQPAPVTAQELLNPPDSADASGPAPGTSGAGEGVAFEITIMEPLRAAQQAVEEQDWDKAYEILQSIGVRMMNYQNAYEKSDPMLYQALMSARGWLSVWYQQLERRLDKDTWSDGQMTSFFKNEVVDVFQRLEGQLH